MERLCVESDDEAERGPTVSPEKRRNEDPVSDGGEFGRTKRLLEAKLLRRVYTPEYRRLEDVAELIASSRNIVVVTGAGISVNSGIPDFRSANGLYATLGTKYPCLGKPEDMFSLRYFRSNPLPFFDLASEMYPGKFMPSTTHRFLAALEARGVLLRNYSQNIDTLELSAGIKRVIYCHGSFRTGTCMRCQEKYTCEELIVAFNKKAVPLCSACPPIDGAMPDVPADLRCIIKGHEAAVAAEPEDEARRQQLADAIAVKEFGEKYFGDDCGHELLTSPWLYEAAYIKQLIPAAPPNRIIKPDITFFGEDLPKDFHEYVEELYEADLLIVIGSSMSVSPVSRIPRTAYPLMPCILINKDHLNDNLQFDVELLGDCDDITTHLADMLGMSDLLHTPATTELPIGEATAENTVDISLHPPATTNAPINIDPSFPRGTPDHHTTSGLLQPLADAPAADVEPLSASSSGRLPTAESGFFPDVFPSTVPRSCLRQNTHNVPVRQPVVHSTLHASTTSGALSPCAASATHETRQASPAESFPVIDSPPLAMSVKRSPHTPLSATRQLGETSPTIPKLDSPSMAALLLRSPHRPVCATSESCQASPTTPGIIPTIDIPPAAAAAAKGSPIDGAQSPTAPSLLRLSPLAPPSAVRSPSSTRPQSFVAVPPLLPAALGSITFASPSTSPSVLDSPPSQTSPTETDKPISNGREMEKTGDENAKLGANHSPAHRAGEDGPSVATVGAVGGEHDVASRPLHSETADTALSSPDSDSPVSSSRVSSDGLASDCASESFYADLQGSFDDTGYKPAEGHTYERLPPNIFLFAGARFPFSDYDTSGVSSPSELGLEPLSSRSVSPTSSPPCVEQVICVEDSSLASGGSDKDGHHDLQSNPTR